jgi:hypothetical protein
MRTLCLLTLLCTSATAAPVLKELKKRGSSCGLWKIESVTHCGRASNVDADESDRRIDETFAISIGGSQTQLKINTVTKEIDCSMGDLILCGRYEVRGVRLTICLCRPGFPRPTTLEPNATNYV